VWIDNAIRFSRARRQPLCRFAKEGPDRAKDVQAIIRRVQGIDPLSWQDLGGETGAIRELGGQLVVTATPEIQQQIAEELRDALPLDRAANRSHPQPAGR